MARESISTIHDIETEGVDNDFVNLESLNYQSSDIYEWYSNAISRRNREPLEEERFYHHYFEGGNFEESAAYGSEENGYLLGSSVAGVFIPTHFAPRTLKGGYKLMHDLMDVESPVALFITEDLLRTIEKMDGWKNIGLSFDFNFRGDNVKKYMVVNKYSAVSALGVDHLRKYLGDKSNSLRSRLKNLAELSFGIPGNEDYYDEDIIDYGESHTLRDLSTQGT